MIRRYGKQVILILILGYILFLAWWLWAAGPATVWRIISYDSSNIEDYKLFPAKTLTASNAPFQFENGTGNGRVPTSITLHNSQCVDINRCPVIYKRVNNTLAALHIQPTD